MSAVGVPVRRLGKFLSKPRPAGAHAAPGRRAIKPAEPITAGTATALVEKDTQRVSPPAADAGYQPATAPPRPGSAAAFAIAAVYRGQLAVTVSHLTVLPTSDLEATCRAANKVSAFAAAILRTRRAMNGRFEEPPPPGFVHCLQCLLGDCGACRDPECRHRATHTEFFPVFAVKARPPRAAATAGIPAVPDPADIPDPGDSPVPAGDPEPEGVPVGVGSAE